MAMQEDPVDESVRPLRADAARNRELILHTAAELFAERGLDVGYDEIARHAGVGVGTVYRRFPDRSALVQALFESRIEEMVAIADEAATRPDAWEALSWFLERFLERQVGDRGLKEVVVATITQESHITVGRDRIGPALDALTERAHRDGSLRPDVSGTDIGVQLLMISSMTVPNHPDLWRRYFALLIDALRARPDQVELPGTSPTDDAVSALLRSMHGRRD